MDFIPKYIEEYADEHTTADSELLKKLYRDTHLKVLIPAMLSGHLQGRFLSMASHMIRPKRILEIGTYTGYSALCLAEGLADDGSLHTIDKNEELQHIQKEHWDASPYKDQIIGHIGDAREIIPSLKEDWDLVFIDADKTNYQTYYDLLIPNMRSNSFLLADNVLWYGKVAGVIDPEDADTLALDKFNKFVVQDKRVEVVLLSVRDGLSVIRKK
ncbi:MAG: methyltransferase [Flavobacteriales bacterium]|nr:methyltransferase [Flavobacteriales bacterium]